MADELGYFTIPVADMAQARTFFGELFGWEFDPEADGRYAHVSNTSVPFGLVAGEPSTLEHLYFRVANVAASGDRARALGGTAQPPQDSPSGVSAVCVDPGGTSFSIWQPAPGY